MGITLYSRLLLVPIEIRRDKKHFIVEDKTSGEFYEMPEVCIEAIKLMDMGKKLGEIEETLKVDFPNEDVDLLGFSNQLLEMDLIEKIDGEKVEKKETVKESLGFYGFLQK